MWVRRILILSVLTSVRITYLTYRPAGSLSSPLHLAAQEETISDPLWQQLDAVQPGHV